MSVLVPRKTYQYLVNISGHAGGDSTLEKMRSTLRTIKNQLKAFPQNPWVVLGSGNSSAAGMDAVDRWVANTDMNAGSWIVLRQEVTNVQLCLLVRGSDPFWETSIDAYISMSGFSGGGVGTRPTAADELIICDGTGASHQWADDMQGITGRVHLLHATDSTWTMVFVTRSDNTLGSVWFLGRPQEPVEGWNNPIIACLRNFSTPSSLVNSSTIYGNFASSGQRRLFGCLEYSNDAFNNTDRITVIMNAPDDLTGMWPVEEIGVTSIYDAPLGEHGIIPDLWAISPALSHGDTMPSDNTKQFMVLGDFLIPWSGVALISG